MVVKSHSVEIGGQKLSIRSDATEAHMRRLADLVNGRLRAVRGATPSVPLPTALALAAIQIADDLCELEDFVTRERREVAAEIRKAARSLDGSAGSADKWLASVTAKPGAAAKGKDD